VQLFNFFLEPTTPRTGDIDMSNPHQSETTSSKEKKPSIQIIKTSKCPSLSGKSTLSYQVGCNEEKELFFRIIANTGGGHFNKDWMALEDAHNQFESCPEKINSHMLTPLLLRKSANSAGFFLAAMVAEKIVQPSTEKQRTYVLQKLEPFLEAMQKMINENLSGKPTPRRKRQPPKPKAPSKDN